MQNRRSLLTVARTAALMSLLSSTRRTVAQSTTDGSLDEFRLRNISQYPFR
jgi:hypothetical protein